MVLTILVSSRSENPNLLRTYFWELSCDWWNTLKDYQKAHLVLNFSINTGLVFSTNVAIEKKISFLKKMLENGQSHSCIRTVVVQKRQKII